MMGRELRHGCKHSMAISLYAMLRLHYHCHHDPHIYGHRDRHVHTYTHIYIHTNTHTCIHTCTHTRDFSASFFKDTFFKKQFLHTFRITFSGGTIDSFDGLQMTCVQTTHVIMEAVVCWCILYLLSTVCVLMATQVHAVKKVASLSVFIS